MPIAPIAPKEFSRRVMTATWIIAVSVLFLVGLWRAMNVVFLIFGGVLLAVIIRAIVEFFDRRLPVSDRVLTWMVLLLGLGGLTGGVAFGIPRLAPQFAELAETIPASGDELRQVLAKSEWAAQILDSIPGAYERVILAAERFLSSAAVLTAPLQFGGYLIFVGFLMVYLALDPGLYTGGLIRFFPLEKRRRVREVLSHLEHTVRRWLLARLAAMAAVGVMTAILLLLLDIPLAVPLGITAGALSFVPYLGTFTSGVLISLVTLLRQPESLLIVIVTYAAVELFEGYVITPVLQKIAVHVPPAVTLAVQILMGVFFGVPGVVFATPLAAVALGLFHTVYVEDILKESEHGSSKAA